MLDVSDYMVEDLDGRCANMSRRFFIDYCLNIVFFTKKKKEWEKTNARCLDYTVLIYSLRPIF